jgi:hypothetical protein
MVSTRIKMGAGDRDDPYTEELYGQPTRENFTKIISPISLFPSFLKTFSMFILRFRATRIEIKGELKWGSIST